MSTGPSPEAQLEFLAKLQRIFAEGDFTATYKYALLVALADLAVELGGDDTSPLQLTHHQIAQKFVELYWQQAAPYSCGRADTAAKVLAQNSGVQAAVVTEIVGFRKQHKNITLQSATSVVGYGRLIRGVARTVSAQPVTYLQNLGGQTDPFLYDRVRGGVVLKPGIGYCLRRFQPLVQQLARNRWVEHIKRNRLNLPMLGESDDLESFLFETPRRALIEIGNGLRVIVQSRCFYCGSRVHDADVDHFIPYVTYPRDLIHNFVLAHHGCNRSKSDTLAAKMHLAHWREYVDRHDDDLAEIGEKAGRIVDRQASLAVARWGYGNAASSGAQAWVRSGVYQSVDAEYLSCLG